MDQPDIVVLMARLASEGCSLAPGDAISALADLLARLQPTLERADRDALLQTGACLLHLSSGAQA